MRKHKKPTKHTNKKSGFSMLPLLLCLLVLVVFCTLGYFTSKDNQHGHEEGEEITVELPEATQTPEPEPYVEEIELPEPIIDIPTIPVSEDVLYSLQMGENVLYTLYQDGTMKVTGTGDTFAFATEEDCYAYYGYRLQLTDIEEMRGFWFDKVLKIEIEPAVKPAGAYSLDFYENAKEVIYLEENKQKEKGG